MSASAKRFYSLLASLALLVGAVIIYSSYIVPLFGTVEDLRGQVSGAQGQLQQLNSISQNMANLSSEYSSSSSTQNTLSAILPTRGEAPTIVNQLQGLAASNNITLSSVSLQYLPISFSPAGSIIQAVGGISLSVQGSGGYGAVNDFLDALGDNIRIFDLSSVTVSAVPPSGAQKSAAPLLNFNASINTYYQIPASSTATSTE